MQQAELELRRVVRYGGTLSIFMMDVDHFKKINDTHGHKVGDLVLQKLAEICRDTLRMVDIIGRVGGEEFAILLPETTEQEAIRVAERLRQAIANAKIPLGHGLPLSITVSIGITSLMSKDDNIDVLLSFADKALYEAKNAGRNRIFNIQDRIGSLVSQ
jgi:diguanylate cyclase (GGDEF)-like protein